MFNIIKKELLLFLGTATGLLINGLFLIITAIFVWIVPGNWNIISNNYATLSSLFELMPWILLFLVPAVTMRMFAEERQQKTLDLLLIRPIAHSTIVLGKYFSSIAIFVVAIIPTIIYVVSLYFMASPVGNIDAGEIWGSYLALLFLVMLFVAIGIFFSAITKNQSVAFFLSLIVTFLFYAGFELLSSVPLFKSASQLLSKLSITTYYDNMRRGVISMRDLIFFATTIAWFVRLTVTNLNDTNRNVASKAKIVTAAITAALFVINIFASTVYTRLDLTLDKRHTLSPYLTKALQDIEQKTEVTIYLDGDLNPGFVRLKSAVTDLLNEFTTLNSKQFSYAFVNPDNITGEKAKQAFKTTIDKFGFSPINVIDEDKSGKVVQKRVFPFAVVKRDKREVPIFLLVNLPENNGEQNLNVSIQNLEYQFADALRILSVSTPARIAFLEGHGELTEEQVYDITLELSRYYAVDRGKLAIKQGELDNYKVVIVAKPTLPFTEPEKYILDQYVMQGGRMMWLVDGVTISADSLMHSSNTVAIANQTNLDDILFKYGVRINRGMVMDMNCALIPINTAPVGAAAQIKPMPWYYAPLFMANPNHPISRNLSPIKGEFSSYIDTVGRNNQIEKTILLASGKNSAFMQAPVPVSVDFAASRVQSNMFDRSYLPTAILLQGTFSSVFKHRMMPENVNLGSATFKENSVATKMIVIACGNLAKNEVQNIGREKRIIPLDYDKSTGRNMFGNKSFLVNAVNYLDDNGGLMELRGKNIILRLLDKEQSTDKRIFWQLINTLLPILVALIIGIAMFIIRRKKYVSPFLKKQ